MSEIFNFEFLVLSWTGSVTLQFLFELKIKNLKLKTR
jgi:hypothetical protein